MEESAEIKHSYGIKKCQEYNIHTYSPIGLGRGDALEDDSLALEEGDHHDTETSVTTDTNSSIEMTPSPFMQNAFTIDDVTEKTAENGNAPSNNKENSKSCHAGDDEDELL